ncbi:hypothetical protein ACSNOI_15835 [Actinomadura kijaniata]|uniref:hypothetical protein n=1 Tax=Actinomadura kijaniata TaxID=46161 RepID=UPI003F193954
MHQASDEPKTRALRPRSVARAAATTAALAVALTATPPGASAEPSSAPDVKQVACGALVGDVAALARAYRAGGHHRLGSRCAYTLTKRMGKNSALPTVTRNTIIEGNGASITWAGEESIRSMFDVAPGARLTMSNLRISPGANGAAPTVNLGRGAVLSLTDSSVSVRITSTDAASSSSQAAVIAADGSCTAKSTSFGSEPTDTIVFTGPEGAEVPAPAAVTPFIAPSDDAPADSADTSCETAKGGSVTLVTNSKGATSTTTTKCCATSGH